ncbi:hypothetical protein Agub_g2080, partial [Astrephomene gubernaculifera]
MSLGRGDHELVKSLLGNALASQDSGACPNVHRAAEAIMAALSGGQQHVELELQAEEVEQQDASLGMHQNPAANTVAELSAQVLMAAGRVSALRKSVAHGVVQAVAMQAEALRPLLRAGELNLTTPGKSDRRLSMDSSKAQRTAALHLNERLMHAADKLRAQRARMDEVSR